MSSVQAILFFSRGVEAVKMTNRKSGKNFTFCLIALDPGNRLRYPPVSLFFDMCWCFWLARGVWENLFHVRFFGVKVGVDGPFLRCRFVRDRFVLFEGFGAIFGHPNRSRNPIWISNGVVRCGFGAVLAVLVSRWFSNVIRGFWSWTFWVCW